MEGICEVLTRVSCAPIVQPRLGTEDKQVGHPALQLLLHVIPLLSQHNSKSQSIDKYAGV